MQAVSEYSRERRPKPTTCGVCEWQLKIMTDPSFNVHMVEGKDPIVWESNSPIHSHSVTGCIAS